MRLFAAIPIEGDALTALEAVLRELTATDWPVRWVRPAQLHLTVKFLGEVEEERVPPLRETLEQATAGMHPLAFELGELGAFPNLTRARVLWAGLEAEGALELMVDRVERGCEALGFPIEGRPFRPHVTLGRLRDGGRLPSDAVRRLEALAPSGNFLADRLVLYHSRPGAGGHEHEPLATLSFGT
jgi:2'-5' RNA ligase